MGSLIAGFVLFLTVSTALILGIAAAYGAISAILFAFGRQSSRRRSTPAPVLVPSQTHAGD